MCQLDQIFPIHIMWNTKRVCSRLLLLKMHLARNSLLKSTHTRYNIKLSLFIRHAKTSRDALSFHSALHRPRRLIAWRQRIMSRLLEEKVCIFMRIEMRGSSRTQREKITLKIYPLHEVTPCSANSQGPFTFFSTILIIYRLLIFNIFPLPLYQGIHFQMKLKNNMCNLLFALLFFTFLTLFIF